MSKLIYLSAVPWATFSQRPHKFAGWFHARTGGPVLWIDPYPTRFPQFLDFKRLRPSSSIVTSDLPDWLEVVRPHALPIEPLPGSERINRLFWSRVIGKARDFSAGDRALVVIGKPSLLAKNILREVPFAESLYDAMDDFPQFFSGRSQASAIRVERDLIKDVDHLWVSSTHLKRRWINTRPDLRLVLNGLDPSLVPPVRGRVRCDAPKVFGYVGTIAKWFDWEWVLRLAAVRPRDVVRLIGPVYLMPKRPLPKNVEVLPPCSHGEALLAMSNFDVGLIPFLKNDLTASVDPIKFYEYGSVGIPVLSTAFGEMASRGNEVGVYLSHSCNDINDRAVAALGFSGVGVGGAEYVARHSWSNRFDSAGLL